MPSTRTLVRQLIASKKTISIAESCTGGRIAARLTSVPGVSAVFWAGWVTYSPESKNRLLGIPHRLALASQIVSTACARALAEAARKKARTDYALSITGWAGPSRSADQPRDQPVGLAYAALATPRGTHALKLQSKTPKNRTRTQNQFTTDALQWAAQIIATEISSTALPKRRSLRVSRNLSK